jgi:AraC family transcriptional regulator
MQIRNLDQLGRDITVAVHHPGAPMARPTTEADYRRRIDRVVDHVAAHLDETLDLARLAEVACFSAHHFHRIYAGLTGETVAETVRRLRLRLRRAAAELIVGDRPTTRIAARAGYASLAAFSRAFRAEYGSPPTRWLRAGSPLPPSAAPDREITPMSDGITVEIRTLPALRLAGLHHRGAYDRLGGVFDDLCRIAGGRGLLGPAARFVTISWDDPAIVAEADLRADACIVVDEATPIEPPLGEYHRPAGRFAVVLHRGPYVRLAETYRRFFRDWLPASGETLADAPPFEDYLDDAGRTAPADLRTEIHFLLAD